MRNTHPLIGPTIGIGLLLSAPTSASCPGGHFIEVDGVIPNLTTQITAAVDPFAVSYLGLFWSNCAVELEATVDKCGFGEITSFKIERGLAEDPLCDSEEALRLPWDIEVTSVNPSSETAQILVAGASVQSGLATCSGDISATLDYGTSPASIDLDHLWLGLCQTFGELMFNETLDFVAE